jgi:hypothetical protein
MTKQFISSKYLQRINEQLSAEELILDEIETILAALNKLDTVDDLLSIQSAEQVELKDLLARIPELSATRRKLRSDLAHELVCPPHHVSLYELTNSYFKENSISENELSPQDLKTLQKKIVRTSGKLKATVSNLLLKRQIVEVSLSALGVTTKQDRYTATGEKLSEQATSLIETRS